MANTRESTRSFLEHGRNNLDRRFRLQTAACNFEMRFCECCARAGSSSYTPSVAPVEDGLALAGANEYTAGALLS